MGWVAICQLTDLTVTAINSCSLGGDVSQLTDSALTATSAVYHVIVSWVAKRSSVPTPAMSPVLLAGTCVGIHATKIRNPARPRARNSLPGTWY